MNLALTMGEGGQGPFRPRRRRPRHSLRIHDDDAGRGRHQPRQPQLRQLAHRHRDRARGRSEDDFDPGAKYHIPGNTPYTRYFLAFVLQFQFQKALCEAAGHKGPLHECDVYASKEAGQKFMDMLKAGASRPWPETLEKLTGGKQMDGSALIEYFQPLMGYLKEQNKGASCGWAK
jgi:hypothetical protein